MEKIIYKDSEVYFKYYNTGNIEKKMRRKCICCGKEMNDCDVVLLINNGKYIPNMLIHEKCFFIQNTEILCRKIENKYKSFNKLKEIFK